MPRKGPAPRRTVPADPRYGSDLVTRLVYKIMRQGKKSLAERIVFTALEQVREKSGRDPVEVVDQALKNAMPMLEVRPRRVGGATYQVPIEVRPERRLSLGIRWIVQFAQERKDKTMADRLAAELLDAAHGRAFVSIPHR